MNPSSLIREGPDPTTKPNPQRPTIHNRTQPCVQVTSHPRAMKRNAQNRSRSVNRSSHTTRQITNRSYSNKSNPGKPSGFTRETARQTASIQPTVQVHDVPNSQPFTFPPAKLSLTGRKNAQMAVFIKKTQSNHQETAKSQGS
ncbi:hypothetical protein LIER_34371 [Lithospermum erythrorhizon]|uniref:Uncharacterized protein n=1 Tax=Lithospermum erythrorhizon TaxID=34254 RepID=A0AAV3RZH0_LITER